MTLSNSKTLLLATSYSWQVSLVNGNNTIAAEILRLLRNAGVETAFGIPGVHNLAFWNAVEKEMPQIINVRHEQTAVYAADGLARATGGIGVAITTAGPGAANALGAFGESSISKSPVLLISSEAPINNRVIGQYRGFLHEMEDQSALFAPLAKRLASGRLLANSASNGREALELIVEALHHVRAAPTGSAYVGIPADILNQELVPYDKEIQGNSEAILGFEEASELIENSDRIAIWAGGGAIEFSSALAVIANQLSALVVTSFSGRGVASESEGYLQLPIHEKEASQALNSADLLIIIGSQFDGMNTKNWTLNLPKKVIVIDSNPELHSRNIKIDISLKMNLSTNLFAALGRIPAKPKWIDAKDLANRTRNRISTSTDGARGMALVSAIDSSWPEFGQILCDMCIAGYWFGGYSTAKRPRRVAYPVGWGTLGFALPASIGAAVAGNPTLVICGDGGIAFALPELATIVQEKLPVTILLHDDGGYGMLRYDQKVMDHPKRGVDLLNPDWSLVAKSYGIDFVVTTIEKLSRELVSASSAASPKIILIKEELHPPKTTSPRWREN
jgi:acetolactate synthase-1/2/3 large subunit